MLFCPGKNHDGCVSMPTSDLIASIRQGTNGDSLAGDLEKIRSAVEPLLAMIVKTFPDFTTHDIRHCLQVLENVDLVMPDSLRQKLSTWETYFLVAAIYLHDVGMVDFPKLRNDPSRPTDDDPETLRRYIRDEHHRRSEEFILGNYRDLEIPDEHQAKIIAAICRGHRIENLHDKDRFDHESMYKNCSVNVPLLAAVLRISDELDLRFERAPLIVYEHAPPHDEISRLEWKTHLSVAGVGGSPSDPLTIKCDATVREPKIHRALKKLETKINRELEDLPTHLHQYAECRRDLPRRFVVQIDAVGYKPYDLRFSLKEDAIVNLVMGERLYRSRIECLREVLKNSVDACRARRERLKRHGLRFEPEIVFEMSPARDRIIVTDNGIGMDEDTIERYFAKIGESFYRSTEFASEHLDFAPLSELGIGLLSCFMLANRIAVETRTETGLPLGIEIDDISDYFVVKPGQRDSCGTTLTLFLKCEQTQKLDLARAIRHYARHIEFVVRVRDEFGRETRIHDRGFETPELKRLLLRELSDDPIGRMTLEKALKNHLFHTIRIHDEAAEGIIGIIVRQDEKLGLVSPSDIVMQRCLLNQLLVSHEGVFVVERPIAQFLPDYFRSGKMLAELDVKRSVLDFSTARNDVVYNNKYEAFKRRMESYVIPEFRKLLEAMELRTKQLSMSPGEVTRFFMTYIRPAIDVTYDSAGQPQKWVADVRFVDLLKGYYPHRCGDATRIRYLKYGEILRQQKPVIVLDGLYGYSDSRAEYLLQNCKGLQKEAVFMLPNSNEAWLFACILFPEAERITTDVVTVLPSRELNGILPTELMLVRYTNYRSDRLLEYFRSCHTIMSHMTGRCYLNRHNPFISLLVKKQRRIDEDKRLVIQSFFERLVNFPVVFSDIVRRQKVVLKLLADQELMRSGGIDRYVLRQDDFPSQSLLEESS